MSTENSAGVGHPICLAVLDAVTRTDDQSYQIDPGALPDLQGHLRDLCADRDGLLEAIFSLLDLASFLRRERSPGAADAVIHLVVASCGDALKHMGAAGSDLLSSFDANRSPGAQRRQELLGLERDSRTPKAEPAPGSIPGPLARLATATGSRAGRRSKKRP